jgi:hypothetical protein
MIYVHIYIHTYCQGLPDICKCYQAYMHAYTYIHAVHDWHTCGSSAYPCVYTHTCTYLYIHIHTIPSVNVLKESEIKHASFRGQTCFSICMTGPPTGAVEVRLLNAQRTTHIWGSWCQMWISSGPPAACQRLSISILARVRALYILISFFLVRSFESLSNASCRLHCFFIWTNAFAF